MPAAKGREQQQQQQQNNKMTVPDSTTCINGTRCQTECVGRQYQDDDSSLREQVYPRQPLPEGATINLVESGVSGNRNNHTVKVCRLVGAGESCLAYIGLEGGDCVTIKECYPAELANELARRDGGELETTAANMGIPYSTNHMQRFEKSYKYWLVQCNI